MKAILAGNWQQYFDYCRFHNTPPNSRDLRYVPDVDSTLGLDFDSYEIVGTFWQRDDCDEIADFITERMSRNSRPTRVSRNAGGGKQSRPALRKARDVVRNFNKTLALTGE